MTSQIISETLALLKINYIQFKLYTHNNNLLVTNAYTVKPVLSGHSKQRPNWFSRTNIT